MTRWTPEEVEERVRLHGMWRRRRGADARAAVDACLRGAAARVRRGWAREAYALDEHGERCPPRAERAIAWCAIGALRAESPPEDPWVADAATWDVRCLIGGVPLSYWNDKVATHAGQVAELLERAADEVETGQVTR